VNLVYLSMSQCGVNDVSLFTSSVSQSVIDKAVDQWRTRLRACVKATAYTGASFSTFAADLSWFPSWSNRLFAESLTDFRGRLQNRSFLWIMFSQVIA